MTDLEVIKHVPPFLHSLNKRALRVLLISLSGRSLATRHRYILEREIQEEFLKLELPSNECELPEKLFRIASVIRSPQSYRHTLGSANPSITFISTLPRSPLAAAHAAFDFMKNFPTPIIVEIGKILALGSDEKSFLSLRPNVHLRTVHAVNSVVAESLSKLKENEPLPAFLEGALHIISLSARILYGNDGGLSVLLKPLSAEKVVLEKSFWKAYSQLERLSDTNLSRVRDTLGKQSVSKPMKRHLCVADIRRFLINSMHYIYAFDCFPENVSAAIQIINNTSDETEVKFCSGNILVENADFPTLNKGSSKDERMNAEIEALLDISAALQSIAWERYYSCEHTLAIESSSLAVSTSQSSTKKLESSKAGKENLQEFTTKVNAASDPYAPTTLLDSGEAKEDNLLPKLIPELSKLKSEQAATQHTVIGKHEGKSLIFASYMDSKENESHQEIKQHAEVERFSDEAAIIIYVIIGGLLKNSLCQQPSFVDPSKIAYLESGAVDVISSDLSRNMFLQCTGNPDMESLVLDLARQLNRIPKSVISKLELRINQQLS
ncbi:hypothetical protein KP509_18G036600 [Ceratopteris richardii]|nr:hypothetical protein KP509_18G036600 [Ceratopteris richardii]